MNGEEGQRPAEFKIPPPPSIEQESSELGSLLRAAKEEEGNKKGTLEKEASHGNLDWSLKFWLKILLFAFVILLNVWWDTRVADWVWYSGYVGGGFHLSDPVLIALVSTSTANFLALEGVLISV